MIEHSALMRFQSLPISDDREGAEDQDDCARITIHENSIGPDCEDQLLSQVMVNGNIPKRDTMVTGATAGSATTATATSVTCKTSLLHRGPSLVSNDSHPCFMEEDELEEETNTRINMLIFVVLVVVVSTVSSALILTLVKVVENHHQEYLDFYKENPQLYRPVRMFDSSRRFLHPKDFSTYWLQRVRKLDAQKRMSTTTTTKQTMSTTARTTEEESIQTIITKPTSNIFINRRIYY